MLRVNRAEIGIMREYPQYGHPEKRMECHLNRVFLFHKHRILSCKGSTKNGFYTANFKKNVLFQLFFVRPLRTFKNFVFLESKNQKI